MKVWQGSLQDESENYINKPVFVLTKGEKSTKGSGRSIEAYSMYEELVRVQQICWIQFGGHPMAAGLSIRRRKYKRRFRRRLNRELYHLQRKICRPKIVIDVPMPVSYITREPVEQTDRPSGTSWKRECKTISLHRKVLQLLDAGLW